MTATYLDSSAIVKLAADEPESAALRRHLRGKRPLVSSALARAEVLRALMSPDDLGIARGRAVLSRMEVLRVNDRILNLAGSLQPSSLRTLDAIHLATAIGLGRDLGQIVTYDERMAEGARQLGLKAVSPG
jgi:predicted nucleic acid-binding protein